MEVINTLFIIGAVIIVGLLAQFIFKKTRIPDVLLLMIFGALLSHFGLIDGFNKNSEGLIFFIMFSLIYVVFYGALSIRLNALFSTMKYAFFSSILNFVIITAFLGLIARLIGFDWILAFSLGALFCVLDGSIINGLLECLKMSNRGKAQIQTESSIVDILVIVGILSLINFSMIGFDNLLKNLIYYLFLSFGIGLIVAIIWAFILKHLGHYSSAPISTMALLVMLYAFAEYIGANGVITIFSFSIILGNVTLWSRLLYKDQKESLSVLNFHTKSFFKDISFLIRTFLFVYLGILVDINQWPYLLVGLSFFLFAYMIRSIILRVVENKELTKKDLHFLDAINIKGITPIVLLAVIINNTSFANIVIGGIIASIFISSILILFAGKNRYKSFGEYLIRRREVVFKKEEKIESL